MIYLVRHGESEANTEGKYQGQTYDTHLTPFGRRQVDKIANYFKDKKIDEILVSPLTRTKETAQKISSVVGVQYTLEPLLLETDHGDWAGKEKKWIEENYKDFYETWQVKPTDVTFPNGENFGEVVSRARQMLDKYPGRDKNLVFVSHDNTIRAILSVAEGRDPDKMWDYPLENASISVLKKTNGVYDLQEIVVDHLDELRSDVAEQGL